MWIALGIIGWFVLGAIAARCSYLAAQASHRPFADLCRDLDTIYAILTVPLGPIGFVITICWLLA